MLKILTSYLKDINLEIQIMTEGNKHQSFNYCHKIIMLKGLKMGNNIKSRQGYEHQEFWLIPC
jgi:hypothetical protein